jgi:hypothetical protein
MTTNSPNWRMADRLAGGRLDQELRDLTDSGMSLRRICLSLYDRYGIEVTAPTVKAWLTDIGQEAA